MAEDMLRHLHRARLHSPTATAPEQSYLAPATVPMASAIVSRCLDNLYQRLWAHMDEESQMFVWTLSTLMNGP